MVYRDPNIQIFDKAIRDLLKTWKPIEEHPLFSSDGNIHKGLCLNLNDCPTCFRSDKYQKLGYPI